MLIATEELRPNNRLDDAGVKRAIKAARAMISGIEQEELLAIRDPDFFWSYRVYQGQHELSAIRAELEARFLAEDNDENIARRCQLRPKGINAYRELFFDVQDRLECSACILHVIIGMALHRGFREQDINIVWKYYGYTYGVQVLEALISQTLNKPVKNLANADIQALLQKDCEMNLLRKSALASRTLKVNDFTAIDILNIANKAKEIDKLSGGGGSQSGAVNAAELTNMLQSIQFAIGDYAQDPIDVEVITRYDQSSSELTTQQLMAAVTHALPDDLKNPPELNYPEPGKHDSSEHGSQESDNAGSGSNN